MLESHALGRNRRCIALLLAQDRVAGVTIFPDDLAIRTNVLAVVTAEATQKIKVTDVVVVSFPVQPHLWEGGAAINALQFPDRIANLDFFGLLQVGILAGIELMNLGGDAVHAFVARLVSIG